MGWQDAPAVDDGWQSAPVVGEKNAAPANWRVAANAASKGMAGAVDMFLNAPQNVANLVRAGAGTIAAAAGRPDLAPEITPTPDYARRALTSVGAIRPENEPVTKAQRYIDIAGQGVGGGMLTPASTVPGLVRNAAMGGISGATGQGVSDVTGSPAAGVVASALAPAALSAAGNRAQNIVNQARLRESENAIRDQTLRAGREAGYVVQPSVANPSRTNKILESVAGKAAVGQEAAIRNQEITNRLVAQELGLPPGTAISESVITNYRHNVAAPYREASAISPLADNTVNRLNQARFNAKEQWNFYNRSGDPAAGAEARRLSATVDNLESALEKIVRKAGKPGLVDDIREARRQIAKSYDIEKALNVGTGNISAPVLGRAFDKGRPFTGNLETIGRMQNAFKPAMRELESVPSSGVGQGQALASAMLGTMGGTSVGPVGVLAAGIPLLAAPTRAMILSKPYQRFMASPSYSPGVTNRLMSQFSGVNQDDLALMSALAAARQQGAQQ